MIRLPDVDPARLAKPRPAARYEVDAEWGGPTALGREAMLPDLALRGGWGLVDDDLVEHRFAAWTREEDARFDEAAAALQPAEAKGFAERATRDSFERAKVFRASLPQHVRAAVDDRLVGYERTLFTRASTVEDRAQVRAVRGHLDASLQEAAIPAAAAAGALPVSDPDKLDRLTGIRAERHGLIDHNPALSRYEKAQRKAADDKAIDIAFAEGLPPEEKRDLHPDAAIETVGERIHRLEADRRAAAAGEEGLPDDPAREDRTPPNPEGFGREAWLNLIRRHRPGIAEGKTTQQILALRADPELSTEMRERGLADSARTLAAHDHAVTPGSLYLAHLASPETALLLLQADPESPAVDVDPAAASDRPDLFFAEGNETKPRTVAEVIALADEAMAGTRPVDWRRELTAVPPDLQSALAADAREAEARIATEAKVTEDGAYSRRLEETEKAIKAGTIGQADLVKAAGEDGWLKAEDFQRLFNLLVKRSAETLEYEATLSKFADPNYRFDSTSADDQRAVDLLYERDPLGNAAAVVDGNPQARGVLRRILIRTGILPSRVRQAMEAAIDSGDDMARQRGLGLLEDTLLWTASETVPKEEKELAEIFSEIRNLYYRKHGDFPSIAAIVAKVEELRDTAVRGAIRQFLGPFGVSLYDWGLGLLDDGAAAIRERAHQFIEEGNKGRSRLEIANRKNFFDGIFTLAMVFAPGPGLGRPRGSRKRGADEGLDAKSFENLRYSETSQGPQKRLLPVDKRTIGGVEYQVFRVRTADRPSSDGAPRSAERHALNYPEPNAIYVLDDGKLFKTNQHKHVVELQFKPILDGRSRNSKNSAAVGAKAAATDEVGHLQARYLGGSSDRYNLFEQDVSFNRREYRAWERHIEQNIDNISNVKISLVRKDPKAARPDYLEIEWVENGDILRRSFPNGSDG